MTNERKIFPKQQIEIVKVLEPKGYGTAGKEVLPVMAKNLSLHEGDPLIGKSVRYAVFNQDLQGHIKPLPVGARFLCDIEERERPDSQYGPDRNIVQIYVQGEPVSKKNPGGGGWKGRSLEDDLVLEAVKRRSIEGQTAMAQVGEFLRSKGLPVINESGEFDPLMQRIYDKYWQAVEKSLDNFLAQLQTQVAKPTTTTSPKPADKLQDKQQAVAKTEAITNDKPPVVDPVKHVGDLLTRANRKGLNPAQVAEIVGVVDVKDVGDLNKAWAKIEEHLAKKADPDKVI